MSPLAKSVQIGDRGGLPLAAVTTGPAPAAIGVIEVSGPGALAAVSACFRANKTSGRGHPPPPFLFRHGFGGPVGLRRNPDEAPHGAKAEAPPLGSLDAPPSTLHPPRSTLNAERPTLDVPPGTLTLGTLHDNETPLDEAFLVYRPPAESWTGEELVELHGHGGLVLLDAVLAALEKRGVRRGTPADLAARAVRNGKIDRIQAEALGCLAAARTPLAARVFLDQVQGCLSRSLRDVLESPPGHIAEKLGPLLATAPFGLALSKPPTVVLAGAANAGKSSLFNAFVGADRAIVHDAPGTTRDPVDDLIAPGGIPIRLVDTAGWLGECRAGGGFRLRPGESEGRSGGQAADDGFDPAAAQAATALALAEADAVLWVVDATHPVPETMRSLAASATGPSTWVFTKVDLLQPGTRNEEPGTPPAHRVSALTGQGVSALASSLPALAGLASIPPPGAPCVFTARQRDALEAARRALPDGAAAGRLLAVLLAPDDPGCFR